MRETERATFLETNRNHSKTKLVKLRAKGSKHQFDGGVVGPLTKG